LPQSTGNQIAPAISDGRIVYMHNRNGNWDIYLTTVGYIPQKATPPPYNGASPQQALPPQNQTQNTPNPLEFTALTAVAMLVAATILITLAAYYLRRKQAVIKFVR
jgi:beta propeller repeat protein